MKYLTAMMAVQFIQFNLNMSIDDYDSVSVFLTEECKESNKRLDEQPFCNINYSGRWTSQEWSLYVLFSLKQICKCSQNSQNLGSFTRNRRHYSSFDKRFVEFAVDYLKIKNPCQVFIQAMKKRTKSKFGTLKRRYKAKSRKREGKALKSPDFQDLMYQEAIKLRQKIKNKVLGDQLKQQLERYEKLRDLKNESQELTLEEAIPSRRYTVIPNIKTRSLANKQKQNGTRQN